MSEYDSYSPSDNNSLSAHSFAQTYGIHPALAVLTITVDTMIFASNGVLALLAVLTAGLTLPLTLVVTGIGGAFIGIVAYAIQRKWYGDDKASALIKASILAFLTALPTNIPAVIYGASGVVGFFRKKATDVLNP